MSIYTFIFAKDTCDLTYSTMYRKLFFFVHSKADRSQLGFLCLKPHWHKKSKGKELGTKTDLCVTGCPIRCLSGDDIVSFFSLVELFTWTRDRGGGRFTKYLTTIPRLSHDNVKVTIDLRRTSNLHEHPMQGARLFLGTIHLQSRKIVRNSVRKLAYDIPKRNFSTF